ncbi:MFS transporter [Ktedonosporobacter rubrisoli]|uniref:MFS transporter n=1 Tax=Ktedonosporobacter rubrisoli TaxID=2509675 RepID=A0A4P6JS33_KTERU|nr:MFS transporter [Ktedonosporobacter rubrisoli]QBD78184.1 MFS transporter [Ktedonosporobacter rubrisoli]
MYTAAQFQHAIPERIDRLPLSRELWRIMFLAGIAWLIESYDIGIIGNILPSLEKQYQLNSFDIGIIATASTLGIVAAVVPAGWLADQIGRKRMLVIGTAFYATFSLLCGFAPNIPSLIALRFIAGLGMGAVFPIPYAIAAELTSRRFRGAMTAILDSFLSFGYFLAPLLAFVLIPQLPEDLSWRIMFYIGGLPLLYVPILIKWMPESPRWLQTRGRTGEADRIVSSLEAVIERRTGSPLPQPQIEIAASTAVQKTAPTLIFQGTYRKRTFMMWTAFACILFIFYAIQTYTPSVLLKQGYGVGNAFLLTTIIVVASIPGKYFAAYAVERFGRKFTLISFTLIAALSAILFGFAQNAAIALFCGCVLSFFGIGVDPVVKIYGAEQYPTSIRETGISFFEGVGRLFGGVLAPFIMAFLLTGVGVSGSYIFVAVIAALGVLVITLFGTETKGESLEKAASASSTDK